MLAPSYPHQTTFWQVEFCFVCFYLIFLNIDTLF